MALLDHKPDPATVRVLIGAEIPFWREDMGAAARISAMLRHLCAQGFQMAVFYTENPSAEDRRAFAAAFPGVPLFTPPLPHLALRMLRRRLGLYNRDSRHTGIEPPLVWEKVLAFRKCCAQWKPAALILNYIRMTPYARALGALGASGPMRIIDTHDVMAVRTARFGEEGMTPLIAVTEQEEVQALSRFDVILAIQEEEAMHLRAVCPGKAVLTTGHASAPKPFHFREAPEMRLLFVGAGGEHNRLAIAEFLERIWPPLRGMFGERLRCVIAGRVAEHLGEVPEGVTALGYAEDLDAIYAGADIVINPVRAGTGLKIKNIEALAHGKPLVTTPVGAEGLSAARGHGMFVAETAKTFLAALKNLLLDSVARREAAEAAHAFATENLSAERVYAPLVALLLFGREHFAKNEKRQ